MRCYTGPVTILYLVAVSVARTSRTWPQLAAADRIGLSVLAAHQESVSRRLSARDGDRFGDVELHHADGGALLVEGAALWLQAEPHTTLDGGDHNDVLLGGDGDHLLLRGAGDDLLLRGPRTDTIAAALGVTREHLSRAFSAGGSANLKRIIDLVRLMNVGVHGIDKTRDFLNRNLRGVLYHGAPTPITLG